MGAELVVTCLHCGQPGRLDTALLPAFRTIVAVAVF